MACSMRQGFGGRNRKPYWNALLGPRWPTFSISPVLLEMLLKRGLYDLAHTVVPLNQKCTSCTLLYTAHGRQRDASIMFRMLRRHTWRVGTHLHYQMNTHRTQANSGSYFETHPHSQRLANGDDRYTRGQVTVKQSGQGLRMSSTSSMLSELHTNCQSHQRA